MREMYKGLVIGLLIGLMIGCSSDSDPQISDNDPVVDSLERANAEYYIPPPELLTVKDTIELMLNEAMARLRYKDNSALYENEFAYLTDEVPFDEYLTYGQITTEQPADVKKIIVDSLTMFEHDSASVFCTVDILFKQSQKGKQLNEELKVYYHRGRWIKPTVSVIKHQAEYDELIRQAEEAAKWEEE